MQCTIAYLLFINLLYFRVPIIQLQDSKGLSHQQVAVLSSELENLAQKLKGEVMIFEFSQHVQKYLHEHNKPGYSSFYEEMVSRNQEKIQYEMLEKQMKEDKERQVIDLMFMCISIAL